METSALGPLQLPGIYELVPYEKVPSISNSNLISYFLLHTPGEIKKQYLYRLNEQENLYFLNILEGNSRTY
jgi:hypothetical protein